MMRSLRLLLFLLLAAPASAFAQGKLNVVTTTEDSGAIAREIGGDKEYALAEAARGFPKPIVAMIVGRHAPAERRMGHAGALIGSVRETAAAKLAALAEAGCHAVRTPGEAIAALRKMPMVTT